MTDMDAVEPLLDLGLNTRYDDLAPEVVERTRMAILDTLAATVRSEEHTSELQSH